MRFARRMSRLGTETAFEVLAIVNDLKAEGRDIKSFCIGEPDFDTPKNIVAAGVKALGSSETHYSPSPGIMPLRESAARYIAQSRGIKIDPDRVVVVPGGKPIIFFSMLATLDEGDEVIYPNPGYPIYESMIDFCGAKPVPLPFLEAKGFSFNVVDLKKRITDKTKMIVLNYPQNPTGGTIPKEDLEEVAKIAVEHDLWVLADEIYSQIVYEGNFESIIQFEGMLDRTILLDGHSKSYAMTGWRLGFGVMNPELATHVARLVTNSVSCTATFTQIAGIEALEGDQSETQAMVKEFKERRDLIVKLLNDIPGFSCIVPKGAFYVFPNVTACVKDLGFKDAKDLQEFLLHKGNVAVLCREHFGRKNDGETEEYLRLSYATSQEEIVEGLGMIKKAVSDKDLVEEWLKREHY